MGALFHKVKRQEREADYSPQLSAVIYIFVVCCLIKLKENFTLTGASSDSNEKYKVVPVHN
jgi:hypothetical protein